MTIVGPLGKGDEAKLEIPHKGVVFSLSSMPKGYMRGGGSIYRPTTKQG